LKDSLRQRLQRERQISHRPLAEFQLRPHELQP
jgi:hypothetical protein